MLTPLWKESTRSPWTPWRELHAMQRDLDRLFDGLRPSETASAGPSATLPTYEVEETDSAFLVTIDVPGVRPDDVHVAVKEGRLEVMAETKTGTRERKFRVAFTLPTEIDESKLEASLEHGVLALALPKAAKPEARQIPVKVRKAGEGPSLFERLRGKKEEGKETKTSHVA